MDDRTIRTVLIVVALVCVAVSIALQFTSLPSYVSLVFALLGLTAAIILMIRRRSSAG